MPNMLNQLNTPIRLTRPNTLWLTGIAALLALTVSAADVSGRKMVWAHYVPWFTPDLVSQMPDRYYDFPQHDAGADPLREEVRRAIALGVDGFFNDMVAHAGSTTAFWDLRPFLKAAEGTDFHFGICLDVKTDAMQQAKELVRMLSTYGGHPNYPRWGEKYVVNAYTFFAWTPDEWHTIRDTCSKAGFPLHLIANVETGFSRHSDKKLDAYAGVLEGIYHFSIMGMGGGSVVSDIRSAAAWSAAHGKLFLPCVWPGYYGAWLNGRNSFYQPIRGFDTMLDRYLTGRESHPQWLHLTTWNDHDETTLQPHRLATGFRSLLPAMAHSFRGLPPVGETDVLFAYFRETLPGTLLRFEALRIPSAEKGPCRVTGWLRDAFGTVVAELPAKVFPPEEWARVEWLVPSASLCVSDHLVPTFEVKTERGTRRAELPPFFFVSPYLANPETVRVSIRDRRNFTNTLSVAYANGILSSTCSFSSPVAVKRAILYRNERPVTCFAHDTNAVLTLAWNGQHEVSLLAGRGSRVNYAVKSFERNGARDFSWNAQEVRSFRTPGWMRLTARVEALPDAELTFRSAGEERIFTPRDILETGGEIKLKSGRIYLSPDCTLRDLPPLGTREGTFRLRAYAREPDAGDAFWVEFECEDGAFAESRVIHPFAHDTIPVEMDILETPVTLDTQSCASGVPGESAFLTPQKEWPISSNRVVRTRVSPFVLRTVRESFEGTPMNRPKLPVRRYPMGPFALTCAFTPNSFDGNDHDLLTPGGWNEGPSLRILADGRVEGIFSGGAKNQTGAFRYAVASKVPLRPHVKSRLRLVNDCRSLRLYVDGILQGETPVFPVRIYGNCSPTLGDGVNGETPTVGLLHDLLFSGNPLFFSDKTTSSGSH